MIHLAVLAAAVLGLAAAAAPAPGAPADVVPFGAGRAAGQSSTTLATGPSSLTISSGTAVPPGPPPFQGHGFSDYIEPADSAEWSKVGTDLHNLWVITKAWHAGGATNADVITEIQTLAPRGVFTDDFTKGKLLDIDFYVRWLADEMYCHRHGGC